MWNDLEIPFKRVTYRDGQLLTACDLHADRMRDDRLRRLHVRHLHETWGIALGFQVRLADQQGKAVLVQPGYAVDIAGRDILLSENLSLKTLNDEGPALWVLTVRYQEDRVFQDRHDLDGLCIADGNDLQQERPFFTWQRADEVRFGLHVPLAAAKVTGGRIQAPLNLRVRRYAKRMVRPHIGMGFIEPEEAEWRHWRAGADSGGSGLAVGIELSVDTSEAGFTQTPHYFAWLLLEPTYLYEHVNPIAFSTAMLNTSPMNGMSYITHPTRNSFVFRVWTGMHSNFIACSDFLGISWCGIQPMLGCEPRLDILRAITPCDHLVSTLNSIAGMSEG
jgi:hypothetical protein